MLGDVITPHFGRSRASGNPVDHLICKAQGVYCAAPQIF